MAQPLAALLETGHRPVIGARRVATVGLAIAQRGLGVVLAPALQQEARRLTKQAAREEGLRGDSCPMAPASMLAFSLSSVRFGLPACSPKSEKPPSALPQSGCAPVGPLKSSLGCSLIGTDCNDAAAGRAAKL